jgi:hypothetical protein
MDSKQLWISRYRSGANRGTHLPNLACALVAKRGATAANRIAKPGTSTLQQDGDLTRCHRDRFTDP